ncbi:MAG: hypothetical protein A2133_07865 [Actinobacteria bacterium RBG_16_64_13]|nr:MAG: hypothetical protein A2133_07865 [Actinobacteria bacterium RBG_16_64_13]
MSASAGKTSRFTSVIFDFDYTLADSSPGVIECANHALKEMDLPPGGAEAIRETIGLSLAATYQRLTSGCYGDRSDEFKRLFLERADQVMLEGIRLFDSARPVVAALRAEGIGLGIVSTKYRSRIEQALQRDGLGDVFAVVVGAEDVGEHKPDPAGLNAAMGKLGATPAEVLYVGDSAVDAEAAQRAGVPFAAVLTGVTPREAFEAYRPFAVIEDLGSLAAIVLEGDCGEETGA